MENWNPKEALTTENLLIINKSLSRPFSLFECRQLMISNLSQPGLQSQWMNLIWRKYRKDIKQVPWLPRTTHGPFAHSPGESIVIKRSRYLRKLRNTVTLLKMIMKKQMMMMILCSSSTNHLHYSHFVFITQPRWWWYVQRRCFSNQQVSRNMIHLVCMSLSAPLD